MPAYDECHPQIVHALEKDGWRIAKEHALLRVPPRTIFIDLQAVKRENGSQQQILLSEVKCFPDRDSTTRELYQAIGQYIIYQAMLDELAHTIPLYLSIPQVIYDTIFDSAVRRAIETHQLKLIVVDLEVEEIVQWIE